MAESGGSVQAAPVTRESLSRELFSSSTKLRIPVLNAHAQRIRNDDLPVPALTALSRLLFETHSFYVDRPSRRAAESCLRSLIANPKAAEFLGSFLDLVNFEAKKASLAPADYFVLTEWISIILTELAVHPKLWSKWWPQTLEALAIVFESTIAVSRKPVRLQATRIARRAIRQVFQNQDVSKDALPDFLKSLTKKSSSSIARNTPLLGVIAGVTARLPEQKPTFEANKSEIFTFFTREIIGSRTVLPQHIAEGLQDFWENYVSLEDLQKEVVPPIEKALLRAPEVVLNDLVTPMVLALPPGIDLSDILLKNLLKPILSNIKSSNASIRSGAVNTFHALASRATDESAIDKIADELLNPLKTNKVPGAEQKVLYSRMLSSLPGSSSLSKKIPAGLAAVALKEPNENAVEAEVDAIAKQIRYAFENGASVESTASDAFVKGLSDKKPSVRRIWALKFGDIIWNLSPDQLKQPQVATFASPVAAKSSDSLKEVISNQIQAAQNGLATVAYVFTALACSRLDGVKDSAGKAVIPTNTVSKQALLWDGKPSFLVNPKVFTKATNIEDLIWATRAMNATTSGVLESGCAPESKQAWSQATIYFLTGESIPNDVRIEAASLVTASYTNSPEQFGDILIQGVWDWLHSLHTNEKDSVAILARVDASRLSNVLRLICPPASSDSETKVEKAVLENQMINLLVLARSDLVPRVTWIDLCLRVGLDPGTLVKENGSKCLAQITDVPEKWTGEFAVVVRKAAYHASSDLAFVAPESAISLLLDQIRSDLNPTQLEGIGSTEASIFRTPEGTAYIDVLATKSSSTIIDKKVKDYDILKWEEDFRAQQASKNKQTKKLTPDEQAKVKAQLAKESAIRERVSAVHTKLQRGVGIIQALATGPPTDSERWIVQAIDMLQEIVNSGAGLVVGDTASLVYLDCAHLISSRVGPMNKFVGVATLRAMGVTQLPTELMAEPLSEMITRILYRLRFLGERPFDVVSLAYMLPLMLFVLDSGGYAGKDNEENDVQLTLALEFIESHNDLFANERLPRRKVLKALVSAMQKYNQHYKLIKDNLQGLVHSIEPTISSSETDVLLQAIIVPEVSVRTAALQAIDNDLDLSDHDYCEEVWVAYHDMVPENAELARTIWDENEMKAPDNSALDVLKYLESQDRQLREATASTVAETVGNAPKMFKVVMAKLEETYIEAAKPRVPDKDEYGLPRKTNLADPWEHRSGIALTLKALSPLFDPQELVSFVRFMIDKGPLGDRSATVRDEMIQASTAIIHSAASKKVEELMTIFESALEAPGKGAASDEVNEAVVILYGALARHLKAGDKRVPKVVQRLLETLSTPSEQVQYAVAQCLPPLVKASPDQASEYVQKMLDTLLNSKKYADQRGAAYGLAGVVQGRGIASLREFRIMSTLAGAAGAKKESNQRQGAFLAYELLSFILGRLFEPYVIQIVPQLLGGFGDSSGDVREACLDASRTCFRNLSSFGVKQILPTLLEGLDEQAWRSKKGACDLLGAMAYLDPQQLAQRLPDIIPPLTEVLNDSHKEVRLAANRSLQRFGEVISNPEIKSIVSILLKALSDATKYTDQALQSLINIQFAHFLDSPSLALVVRILERGLGDRSSIKKKAAQIIGNLAHLTERKDLMAHLPILVSGLRVAMVDPVPATRATASKALGSLVEKLGEDALPDLIPSLMATLKSDTGAGDRLGSAQALSEVLAGLGTSRLEETLPSILQNVSSSKAAVREGFMTLFIFLPACFGNSFANYLVKIIPSILGGLADEVESIRETALRAGRLLVKNFATRSIDLLLPELERGLGDVNHRIRLSSVELIGDLLFNLSGISAKQVDDDEDLAFGASEAGQSLLEVLGEEKRNRVLSALYICRVDTSGLVRTAAINVWKALVATPRTLREITPTLTQLIIRRLASTSLEQKTIASNALGELIRKAGENVLATLLPTLEEGLETTDPEARQGICMALRDVIIAASPDAMEEHEKLLFGVVRKALVNSDENVRDAAAQAFDALQRSMGKKAVEQVLPYLLNLMGTEGEAENALSALLTLLTDHTRSNIILPNLVPTLLTTPISSFNAQALASLSRVASGALDRFSPTIIKTIIHSAAGAPEKDRPELMEALGDILLNTDDDDGLDTVMRTILDIVRGPHPQDSLLALEQLGPFVEHYEEDLTRFYPELMRVFVLGYDTSNTAYLDAAVAAQVRLVKRCKKDDLEALIAPTRITIRQLPTKPIPGFEHKLGISGVLPIFNHGLMYGTTHEREKSALAMADIIDRTSNASLARSVTGICGPLIRMFGEKSVDARSAIVYCMYRLVKRNPTGLRAFFPQLLRSFAKALATPESEIVRRRAALGLGELIKVHPRIDPLVIELVTGCKSEDDAGVRLAMQRALYNVVENAGKNLSQASISLVHGLVHENIDRDLSGQIANAMVLGALMDYLGEDQASTMVKKLVMPSSITHESVLNLNSVLVEAEEFMMTHFYKDLIEHLRLGLSNMDEFIVHHTILATGKVLLSEHLPEGEPAALKPIFQRLGELIDPSSGVSDHRRLALVVVKTVARLRNPVVHPHLGFLVPSTMAGVRDMVIPVKLAAEAAMVEMFRLVEEEAAMFDKWSKVPAVQPLLAKSGQIKQWVPRVGLRLAVATRERREANGPVEEEEDEEEVNCVGRVEPDEVGEE
ncbi:translational activator [Microthyrium microscopicum]|uniref:eIF-2-alpha kinase activator GCN1 n=1 Tax=Microthyrium microscopicum TaxID=703497 RepID=A0A6A6TZA1_9PEZI|nr:translational activator [Microthyrium microscopicum]